jgi:hypothetical protein
MKRKNYLLALQIAEFIKAGPEAAEQKGIDRSAYNRHLVALMDREILKKVRSIVGPEGYQMVDDWINSVRAGGQN